MFYICLRSHLSKKKCNLLNCFGRIEEMEET
nr:MAG TPA: hypothetical protein [Caudoviricetes sp.]